MYGFVFKRAKQLGGGGLELLGADVEAPRNGLDL